MSTICPHCQNVLKFPPQAQAKISEALQRLPPGKKLPLKCPFCKNTIELDKDGSTGQAAVETPGPAPEPLKAPPNKTASVVIRPPLPQEIDWMNVSGLEQEEQVEDVPMALILHHNPAVRNQIEGTLAGLGYKCISSETIAEAIERMQFVNFANVIAYELFDSPSLKENTFHQYMRQMSMSRRREILYVLIGPNFHTLYDLEALANSANLVVNEKDLAHLEIALHKATLDFERLFGPLMEVLSAHGKK